MTSLNRSNRSNYENVDRVLIKIAGITIAVSGREHNLTPVFEQTMEKFFVTEGDPDTSLTISVKDIANCCASEKSLVFNSGALWQMFTEGDGYCIELISPRFGDQPYKIAHFDKNFTHGEVIFNKDFFTNSYPLDPFEHPLGEVLITNLLAQQRGVEVHGCGLSNCHGQGYLFAGQSGAGKSTMASIWQEHTNATILSDERVILHNIAGQIFMSGTPWHGEARMSLAGTVPLNKIFLLRHGQSNELRSYHTSDAVANLFSCCFPTFHNASGLIFTLDFLAEVASTIPCSELLFIPDKHVIELIDSH